MEMLLGMRNRRVKRAAVTAATMLGLVLRAGAIRAQNNPDETAIRQILDSEVTTWNKGDTDGYSRHFAADRTFTNTRGMFFTGHQEFSGFSKAGAPPGTQVDANGRLRTRLLQVLKKDGGEWKIVVYHNVDVKPGVPVPEPR
jgi:ketosteroid isomerase-like protein